MLHFRTIMRFSRALFALLVAAFSLPGIEPVPTQILPQAMQPDALSQTSNEVQTTLDHDPTGVARLTGLAANPNYCYEAFTAQDAAEVGGSFLTLPDARTFAHEATNPEGCFNSCFEYGSCNDQGPTGTGAEQQAYDTMLLGDPGE